MKLTFGIEFLNQEHLYLISNKFNKFLMANFATAFWLVFLFKKRNDPFSPATISTKNLCTKLATQLFLNLLFTY